MSTISLRLPVSLHRQAKELAAEDHLEKRAARGSREKFDRVMRKVKKTPPTDYDRLPD